MSKYEVDGPEEADEPRDVPVSEGRVEMSPLTRMRAAILGGGPIKGTDVNRIARDCLIVAEAMAEEAKEEMRAAFDKEAREFKARLDNAVDKGGKVIAESEELTRINVEANFLLTEHANTIRSQAAEIEELKKNNMDMGAAFHTIQNELNGYEERIATYVEAINNQGTVVARQAEENKKLWADNRELNDKNKTLLETKIRLAAVIDDLASVIRNT